MDLILMEIAFKRHQNLTVTCLRSPQNLSVNHVVERKTEKKGIVWLPNPIIYVPV